MVLVQGITILSGLVLSILLTRQIGVEGYGRYVFVLTIVHLLSVPVQMGLPTLLMRQVAIYRSQNDLPRLAGIVRWSVRFVSITFASIGVIGTACFFFLSGPEVLLGDTYVLNALGLLLVGVLGFMHISAAILRGFERVFLGGLPDGVIRQVTFLLIVFIASHFTSITPTHVMGFHLLATCCALVWAIYMIRRYCRPLVNQLNMHESRFESKVWLGAIMPLSLAYGISLINGNIDIFMLGILGGSLAEVGVYQVAMKISSIALVGQSILYMIMSPIIANQYASHGVLAIEEIVSYTTRLTLIFTALFLLAFQLFGSELMAVLYGQDFSSASQLTIIRCYGYIFAAALGPVTVVLNMTGHEGTIPRIVGITAIMNITLNFFLIPTHGAIGAAVATAITVFFSHLWMWFQVRRSIGLRIGVFSSIKPLD